MALVEVRRVSGGYTEHLHPFEVVIDDEVVGQLASGDSLVHEVTAGPHELYVKIYWCSSEKVDVDLEEEQQVVFSCDTRANLLTDGYWATFGRRRYLRLSPAVLTNVGTHRLDDGRVGNGTTGGKGVAFGQPQRSTYALLLMLLVGMLSIAMSRSLGFLASVAIIFIAVEATFAINFKYLSPAGPVEHGSNRHFPFRFRMKEEALFSVLFAVVGVASLIGILSAGKLAGWLAEGAAVIGGFNVYVTRRDTLKGEKQPVKR